MYPVKPFSTKVIMSAITSVHGLSAVLGNGSVLTVIARFKSLRTFPNILIANLSVVDLLNAVINMPIFMVSTVWETRWFKGKSLAIMTSFFNRLFIILNLASMLALMINMYFAIAFDLKYFTWKTNKKAVVSACLLWIVCTMMVGLCSIPLLGIDLGDAHVIEYRAEIYKQGKYFIAAFMAFFIICCGVIGFQTIRSIKKKKNKIAVSSLPVFQTQARLQTDIKATKTIAITVAAYFFSYVPAIVYAVGGQREESQADSWFAFIAWNATFFSSTANPIIYYLRTSRFRSAFKQFLKDPFGSSDFREKPGGHGNGKENRALEGAGITKENGDEEANGSGSQEKYHGERRNGIMVLSIKALQAHSCVLEAGECNTDVRGKLPRREAFGSISAPPSCPASLFSPVIERGEAWTKRKTMVKRKSCQATAAEMKDENEEVSAKSGVENETKMQKGPSSGEKGHHLENLNSRKNRHQADEKGEIIKTPAEQNFEHNTLVSLVT